MAHLALEELYGWRLPPELDSYEMFTDQDYFSDVPEHEVALGDVVWFGRDKPLTPFAPQYDDTGDLVNWSEFPVNHVGIAHSRGPDGELAVLHATHFTGGNTIWSLSQFSERRCYSKLFGIRRLKS